jgi:hypothetical protein
MEGERERGRERKRVRKRERKRGRKRERKRGRKRERKRIVIFIFKRNDGWVPWHLLVF